MIFSISYVLNTVFLINILLAFVIVFFERRKPINTLVWLMVLFFIPLLGFILYLFLGQDMKKRKLFQLKSSEETEIMKKLAQQKNKIRNKRFFYKNTLTKKYQDLILFNLAASSAILTQDNQIEIFSHGIKKFSALATSIQNAKSFIYMEYYIFKNDSLGEGIRDLLIEKAQAGVEVKVLYDGMGCIDLPYKFFNKLKAAGGEVAIFYPPFLPYINLRVNYRNHRKICIIDDFEGYTGGTNIGKEYLGLSPKFGFWRDLHLKIVGSAVQELKTRFILDWRFAVKNNNVLQDRLSTSGKNNFNGNTSIQIASCGPDSKWKAIQNAYLKIISNAKDHVYIETPYFIPDEGMVTALQTAALAGVDIRIIVPSKPDHLFVYWANLSYIGELLDSGVRFYHYQKGFIHSKLITADGFVSSLGTTNMDVRSFQYNFEVNAFIYDEKHARTLEEIFIKDMFDSMEMTLEKYQQRSLSTKFKESISRLISPLL